MATYSDDFNRADGPLTTPWVLIDGALPIISNKVSNSGGALLTARYNQTIGADHWVEVDLAGQNGATGICGPTVRTTVGGDLYYFWLQGGAYGIFKRVSGTYSQAVVTGTAPSGTAWKVRMEAEGTTLRLYFDGVLFVTGTDSGIATGQPGILANGGGATLDNWRCGDMPYVPAGGGTTPVTASRTTTWNVATLFGPKVGLGSDTTVGTGSSTTSTTTLSFTHGVVAPSETLIVAIGSDNTTNATSPTVSSITKDGSESGSWVLIGNVNSSSSGSAGGTRGFLYAITATVPWTAASKTITFSAAVTAKAAEARTFYGVTTTPRGTNPSGTTNGAGVSVAGTPTATTSGTAPITGDLVVGVAVNEATTAPSVDSDTLNGAWVGFGSGAAGNTGTALTSAAVRGQYKIVTADGNQTLNPTCSGDSGVAVVALVPQQLATITANRTTTWNVAATGSTTPVTASRTTTWNVAATGGGGGTGTDDFNRADGAVGNGWSAPTQVGPNALVIVSNTVRMPTGGVQNAALQRTTTNDNTFIEVVLNGFTGIDTGIDLHLGLDDDTPDGYVAWLDYSTSSGYWMSIGRNSGGSYNSIAGDFQWTTPAFPATVRFERVGGVSGTLNLKINGTTWVSASASAAVPVVKRTSFDMYWYGGSYGTPIIDAASWDGDVAGSTTQVTASRTTKWYVGTTFWKGVGVVPEGHVTADNALLNVSWFYDWANYSVSGHENDTSGNVQYVPMMWGDWVNDTRWGVGGLGGPPAASIGSSSVLLGFNEPDDGAQSNMSVGRALELWPLLEATGARLGSPAATALNTTWLASFMAGASGYVPRVDFICLHDYPGWGGHTLSGLADYIDYTYATYHKPIWLTEVSNLSGDVAYNAALIPQVMSMLATRPFVERIAWFIARDNAGFPGTRLVENTGVLTAAGTAYASYPSRIGPTTPVTASRTTTWNVAAPLTSVSASRTTTWANRATVATATRTTTWTVRTEVKPSRTTTWSTKAAVTATRTTTWSTLTTVATATRTTSWAVRAQVLPTRTTTWGVLTSVTAATRTTTWAVRAQVLPSRTTTWAVLNPPGVVTAARTTTWSTSGPIATVSRTTTWAVLRPVVGTASRTTTWFVRSEVAVVRTSTWTVLQPVVGTTTRTTTWAVLSSGGVAVSRTTTWEVQQSITRGCTTTWTVLAPMALVIAARTTLWTVRVRANASRTTTWEVLPSVPSSGSDYLVLHPDTVMYLGTCQIKALYKDQSLAWSVTPTTLAAQGGSSAPSSEE